MTYNHLTCLPLGFRELNKLRKLDLRENKLEMLIDSIYEEELENIEMPVWPYLACLDVSKNRL